MFFPYIALFVDESCESDEEMPFQQSKKSVAVTSSLRHACCNRLIYKVADTIATTLDCTSLIQ